MAQKGPFSPALLGPPDICFIYSSPEHEVAPSGLPSPAHGPPVSGPRHPRNSLSSQSIDHHRRGSNVSIISVKGRGFQGSSRPYKCWKCNKRIFTRPKQALTTKGWALSALSCLLCPLFAICLIPAILKSQNIVIHKCPICKTRLGSNVC
ncbi:hypothetical protein HDE_13011 [Halotydeus destructor]|nr:hypothetical protein HDE_13011 [Halotydeus destructor]